MSGWWAERFAKFQLDVEPLIGIAVGSRSTASMNLAVAPELSMEGAGTSTAELVLTIAPEVSITGVAYRETLALNIEPSIAMESPASNSVAAFELTLTPAIGMSGAEHYTATFTLTVSPSFTATAYVKQLPHPIPWTL